MQCIAKYLLALITINLAFNAHATNDEPADIHSRAVKYHVSYYVNDDLTQITKYDTETLVVRETAIESLKTKSISYSTSIETLDVIDAYTKKADGSKIQVPETNYQQRVNSGKDNKGPVFSDRTKLTIVFPDVEVGDTLVSVYTISTTEPMFPGQFTAQQSFSTDYPYDDAKIVLDVPSAIKAQYKVRSLNENIEHYEHRTKYTWSYANPEPNKEQRENFSVWNMESYPGVMYSTFESYEEIAQAYAARALPKARVTQRIQSLAKEILQDEQDDKEKARILYEWVAQNITYAGNCIGVGAVVPHDIDFILDNRMGDCKDQATLLQALYTASGIESTQALINSGSIYSLPTTPTVTAVNHVINYLPAYDLFVDATSETTPFGLIPFSIQDKPVLLVDGYSAGMRTPTAKSPESQRLISNIEVDEQGNASGTIEIFLQGLSAATTRAGFRHTTPNQEETWLKDVFSRDGIEGFGTLTKDDPKPMRDTFEINVQFDTPQHIPLYGLAAFKVAPLMPTQTPISRLAYVAVKDEEVDVVCSPIKSVETYIYTLPDNIEIMATPENARFEAADIRYESNYSLEGNKLRITRSFDDQTKGNVCSPAYIRSQKEIMRDVIWDINSQVVYKVKSSS